MLLLMSVKEKKIEIVNINILCKVVKIIHNWKQILKYINSKCPRKNTKTYEYI